MQKEKNIQIDEIDKELNRSYVSSLLKVKGDEVNPILFGEMPLEKYHEMRKNKKEQISLKDSSLNSSFHNSGSASNRNINSEVRVGNNYSIQNNVRQLNNSDSFDSSFQQKPIVSNKYTAGRNLIMNTGTNVIESSNFNPIKVLDEQGSSSTFNQNKTPNQIRINKVEDKNSFSRLGFDKETEKNTEFNHHLEYNLKKVPRHSVVDKSKSFESPNRNRNTNKIVLQSESFRSPLRTTLLNPEIDQKIMNNNKMDHINSYIFNSK